MPKKHSGPTLATRDGLTVIDCRDCGWAHLWPMPETPADYYEKDFWSTKGKGWLARYEGERDWLDMRHGDWLSVVEEHTEQHRGLLDVGSGYGFFLASARQRSWSVAGIEPSREAYDYTRRDYPVWPSTWQTLTDEFPVPCDCISALWLMEHLLDPRAFLAWCKAHLAPGGVLLLAVPQEWTQYQAVANEHTKTHDWWVHPTHINYFSAPTLYGLLGRSGFRVVDALATSPIEKWILDGLDYPGDEALGDKLHATIRRAELEKGRVYRMKMERLRAREAVGRDLIVFAKAD